MRLNLFVCVTCALLISCQSTVTYRHVSDPKKLRSIKTVAIAPYLYNETALALFDSIYEPLDTTLINHLKRASIFQSIVTSPRPNSEWDHNQADVPIRTLEAARAKNVDALLFCELDVSSKIVYFSTHWAGIVTLTLISVSDSSKIMYARYNSSMPDQGLNTTPLEPPEAVQLATAGAVRYVLRAYVESK